MEARDVTMETYIEMTPRLIEVNVRRYHDLTDRLVSLFRSRGASEIRIVASCSSHNASVMARPCMEHLLGMRVCVLTPARYLEELERLDVIAPQAFEVFISQSGCSTNIIEAVRAARAAGHPTVALTGNVQAALCDEVDEAIEYGVGNETVDFVTLGVGTLVQFLVMFALGAAEATGKIDAARREDWLAQISAAAGLNREMRLRTLELMDARERSLLAPGPVFMCGTGPTYGLALEGALKWEETLKAPAMPWECEEHIHGPNMQLTPSSIAVFLDADHRPGRTYDTYLATREVTDRAYLFAAYPDPKGGADANMVGLDGSAVHRLLAPLYLLPSVQLLSAHAMIALDCEETHPLFKRFERHVNSKTADYDEVMRRKREQLEASGA